MRRILKIALVIIVVIVGLGVLGAIVGPSPETGNLTTATISSTTNAPVASTTANTASASYQFFQDSEFGFSVQVPGGWLIFKDPTPSTGANVGITPALSVHPAAGQGFTGSFVVSVDQSPRTNSSVQYLPIYKEKLAQIWSSYGITFGASANSTLGGQTGFTVTYVVHFPSDVGGDCPERDVVTIHNGLAYTVSLDDCKAQEASAYLGMFNTFVATFGFLS